MLCFGDSSTSENCWFYSIFIFTGRVLRDVKGAMVERTPHHYYRSLDALQVQVLCSEMFVSPPKFICWNSNVPSIGLRWGFLEAISHNSRALTNAFHKQLLYKRGPRELPCPFRHVRTRSQQSDLREGRRPSSDQAGTLIVVFQPPELWGINFVVYRLPSLWYYTAAQMD